MNKELAYKIFSVLSFAAAAFMGGRETSKPDGTQLPENVRLFATLPMRVESLEGRVAELERGDAPPPVPFRPAFPTGEKIGDKE